MRERSPVRPGRGHEAIPGPSARVRNVRPPARGAGTVLALQRAAGNHEVARLVSAGEPVVMRVRAPADHSAAEAAHTQAQAELGKDRARLMAAVASGKRQRDAMLVNSIEWIEDDRRGVRLYAVRPTGDSAERGRSGEVAFFPKASEGVTAGHLGDQTPPTYAWTDLDDNRSVHFDTPRVGGWADGGQIAIVVGRTAEATLWQRIKHEVQHVADRHLDAMPAIKRDVDRAAAKAAKAEQLTNTAEDQIGQNTPSLVLTEAVLELGELSASTALPGPEEVARQLRYAEGHALLDKAAKVWKKAEGLAGLARAERAFEQFKTEYRAYWYMGDPELDAHAESTSLLNWGTKLSGLVWTDRQLAIVGHILDYPEVRAAFEADAILKSGKRFIQAVNEYVLPDAEGYNKLNSVRVDDVYDALRRIPAGTRELDDAGMAELMAALKALRPEDVSYLGSTEQAAAMSKLLRERLAGEALVAVRARIPPPKKPGWGFF